MRALLRLVYAPAMLVGCNGVAIWIVQASLPHWWLVLLLAGAIALSFAVEHLVPYEPIWNRDLGDSGRDIAHAVINEASIYLSVGLVPVLTRLRLGPSMWPTEWPVWAQLCAAILVADFGITVCHYLSHRHAWLWRLHAVHHSVRRMYGFNGLIKHPLHQALETAAGTAPLVLAGMPPEIGLLLGFAVAVQLLLQHSNVDMRLGPLRYLLALAPLHRFHHQKWAGVGDVNFGLFTTVWDHLLGTAVYEPDRRFTSEDLGIGTHPDYPTRYVRQLVAPFR